MEHKISGEKYSRQIRLFGEETQKKIEETRVVVLSSKAPLVKAYIERLIVQMGGTLGALEECRIESAQNREQGLQKEYWIFSVDQDAEEVQKLEESELERVFYISTRSLSVSTEHNAIQNEEKPESLRKIEESCRKEFLKIVAGVAVQEYTKKLSGPNGFKTWQLDTPMFL